MKKLVAVSIAAMMAASVPFTAFASDLTFTTGGEQGTYYAFGTVLAGQISNDTDTTVTAITSGGSQANLDALDMGDAEIGYVQSDVLAQNIEESDRVEEPVTDVTVLAALYMEQVQIITCDPEIKSVADLEGKNVSIGAAGSGVYYNAIDILEVYGLTEDDINPTYQSFGDSADALKDGKIDAAFVTAGAPTTAVTDLSTAKDVYLITLDDEHIEALQEARPYYTKTVIAADVYGLEEDAITVAVGAVVVANEDVTEEDAYNIVSTIFEQKEAIAAAHAKGNELDVEFAASVVGVPYHVGAAKYFEEKGLTVPVE